MAGAAAAQARSPRAVDPGGLQEKYDNSVLSPGPQITTDAIVGPLTIRTGVAAVDITRYEDSAGVVQHSWQETSITMGPAVTDIFSASPTGINFVPSLFPTRPTINIGLDALIFLNSDRIFTAIPGAGGLFSVQNTFTLNFPAATLGAFVRFAPTIQFQQDANGFGGGLVINSAATFENLPSVAANLSIHFTFVGQNIYRANAQTITMNQDLEYLCQPRFEIAAGGTLTDTSINLFIGRGRILAGVTVTGNRRVFVVDDIAPFTGTLTGINIGLDIGNITSGTGGAIGIRSVLANGSALRRFISHTGTAESDFGGTINLSGAALFNHAVSDAPGAGAIATLALIGATGPTVAAQSTWVRVELAGVIGWVPLWI